MVLPVNQSASTLKIKINGLVTHALDFGSIALKDFVFSRILYRYRQDKIQVHSDYNVGLTKSHIKRK